MPRAGARPIERPIPGRGVLSYSAHGRSWSVSTPLMDGTPKSLSAGLAELIQQLCTKTSEDLHPPKKKAGSEV